MAVDVDAVVSEIARVLDTNLPELTTELTTYFVEVIPEFQHDETVRQLMVASTSSNLEAIVDVLAHKIPVHNITVPPAAAEYARRFAQHELSLEALLRAYRLGQHRLTEWALALLTEMPDLDTSRALAAVADITQRVNRYIDQVSAGLIDIYAAELRRWNSRTGAARTAQLRTILENENLTDSSAEHLLGTPLSGRHQAAIVWVAPETPDPDAALQAANRLLTEASGRNPLTMLADDHTMWAWLSGPSEPLLDRALLRERLLNHPGLSIALGSPGARLNGFRGTLREAQRARKVAETMSGHSQLVGFDEVAIAALLTDHPDDLRNWTERVLGGLAATDDSTARLRATVRCFLEANGSFTEAAARLHLHKNTVSYRIRKAEEVRGRPFGEGRLDVEVALLVCDLLWRRVHAHAPPAPTTSKSRSVRLV
ncbi:helix-turn-helix domain-containing protein [Sporichthya sp.]|uniref:PucR family transcriptional regulator n=1 Tax=Sporichthya sp. TaxID=65475 RepID=UPI0017B9E317|nr:helix-turn-helix domain-containing protein [Sporichthya sp.]MBA3744460.1 helix-turn-helix domain-containing protein [Sporichthya sp.]